MDISFEVSNKIRQLLRFGVEIDKHAADEFLELNSFEAVIFKVKICDIASISRMVQGAIFFLGPRVIWANNRTGHIALTL